MLNFYIANTNDLRWAINFFQQQNFHFPNENSKLENYLPFNVSVNNGNSLCFNQQEGIPVENLRKNIKSGVEFFLCDKEGKVYGPLKYIKADVEIGDKVKITSTNGFFITYYNWFKENNIDIELASRYAYGNSGNDYINKIGKVVACGIYGHQKDSKVYAIEFQDYNNYVLTKPIFLCNKQSFELL